MAPREPMPRITLKRRPSSRNDSPGLSSVPASIEPIITLAAPAASALTTSPEYLTPPSAITGTSPAPFTASTMAVICGTPTPVTTRVVQIEPGPTPTFTASTPRSTNALARACASAVPPTAAATRSRPCWSLLASGCWRRLKMSLMVIKPRRMPCLSTTGSFSMRCLPSRRSASSIVVPTGAVTSLSLVIASLMGRSSWRSNCRSRLVMIPTSLPASSTIGTPEILKRAISWVASRTGRSGPSVIGFRIIPDSLRFTRSTSAAWRSMDMFLWITPMPPSRAMAIAMSDSVTVSIAAETSGMLRGILRVNQDFTSTLRGCTVACRGTSNTSSNVSAGVGRKVPMAKVMRGAAPVQLPLPALHRLGGFLGVAPVARGRDPRGHRGDERRPASRLQHAAGLQKRLLEPAPPVLGFGPPLRLMHQAVRLAHRRLRPLLGFRGRAHRDAHDFFGSSWHGVLQGCSLLPPYRPVGQQLEVRLLHQEIEGQNRDLVEGRGQQPQPGAAHQRQAVRRQVADGIHRILEEAIGAGRTGRARRVGSEEVVPVVARYAQLARRPHLDPASHHNEQDAAHQQHARRRAGLDGTPRHDAQQHEAEHVVVHQRSRQPAEATEAGLGAVTAREHLIALLAREGDPYTPGVRHAADQVIPQRERRPGHAVLSLKPRLWMYASSLRAAWRRMLRCTGGNQPSSAPLAPSACDAQRCRSK